MDGDDKALPIGFEYGKYSVFYYVRHVFYYLREHSYLLALPDYKRLYEEVLDFQIRYAVGNSDWDRKKYVENRGWIEFFADLKIGKPYQRFSEGQIQRYLDYRRAVWNSEKRSSPAK